MLIAKAIIGIVLLAMGRQLYWLLVGSVGFFLGMQFIPQLIHRPDWLIILLAISVGVVGVILVTVIQRLALGLIGFLAGGYILLNLRDLPYLSIGHQVWLLFLIGGILGIILQAALYDWTLIFLSSFIGIILIGDAFHISNVSGFLILTGLFIAGIFIQANALRGEVYSKYSR